MILEFLLYVVGGIVALSVGIYLVMCLLALPSWLGGIVQGKRRRKSTAS